MIGHKTSGDWSDVTSYNRNEIVFEGRNKDYGAYLVRQRYNGSLLLALLISTSIGVICAGIPFIVHLINPAPPKTNTTIDVHVTPIDIPNVHPPVTPPPPPPPTHNPPPSNSAINRPPIVANTPVTDIIPPHDAGTDHPTTGPTNPDPNNNPVIPTTAVTPVVPVAPPPPMTIVEKMPAFKGDLEQYIKDHVEYSDIARQAGIQGTVFVSFIVETDGSISDVELLRGISNAPELNDAAMKVIKEMPGWNAGMQNGHSVRVRLNLPIKFSLGR